MVKKTELQECTGLKVIKGIPRFLAFQCKSGDSIFTFCESFFYAKENQEENLRNRVKTELEKLGYRVEVRASGRHFHAWTAGAATGSVKSSFFYVICVVEEER